LFSVMSGMEVTKKLSSAGIAYADLLHLPRSGRATHSSAGPALGARSGRQGSMPPCSPPAEAAPTRLHASCCYQTCATYPGLYASCCYHDRDDGLPRWRQCPLLVPVLIRCPDDERGSGQRGVSSACGASSRSAPAGFSPGHPSPVIVSPPIWSPDDCLTPRPPSLPDRPRQWRIRHVCNQAPGRPPRAGTPPGADHGTGY